jgi:hypothetical protein
MCAELQRRCQTHGGCFSCLYIYISHLDVCQQGQHHLIGAVRIQAQVKQVLSHLLLQKFRAKGRVQDGSTLAAGSSSQQIPADATRKANSMPGSVDNEGSLLGRSLGILLPDNVVRRACAYIIWHPRFEQAIILFILASSITLAIDSPGLDPHSRLKSILVRIQDKPYCFIRLLLTLFACPAGKHVSASAGIPGCCFRDRFLNRGNYEDHSVWPNRWKDCISSVSMEYSGLCHRRHWRCPRNHR